MSIIRVKSGFFGTTFDAALKRGKPGDSIYLSEGRYDLTNGLNVYDLKFIGDGDRDKVIINGNFSVQGSLTLENLTLNASSFRNAIYMDSPQATAYLVSSTINGEITGRYPAIYLTNNAQVFITNSTIQGATPEAFALSANRSSIVTLEYSALGEVEVVASQLHSTDISLTSLLLLRDSKCIAHGSTTLRPNEGKRALILQERSEATLDSLDLSAQASEVYIEESVLTVHDTITATETPLFLYRNYSAVCLPPNVEAHTIDLDQEEREVAERDIETQSQVTTQHESPNPQTQTGLVGDPIAAINDLTGLIRVKEEINNFFKYVKFNQLRAQKGLSTDPLTMHSLFLGAPGTGKTTVARLLGQALYQVGAIPSNTFIEKQPADFIDGHNTPKVTQQILESARGGVLFIDEAYGFYKENNNEFAVEALNQLLAYMENHRTDLVVIMAGYPEQMQKIFSVNPGLESRIPHSFTFENYSPAEIAEIGFKDLVSRDYRVDEQLYKSTIARTYAQSLTDGNARWVREFNNKLVTTMMNRVLEEYIDDVQTIADNDLLSIAGGSINEKEAEVARILGELEDLIGLESVKTFVHNLVAEAKFDQKFGSGASLPSLSYHMVFSGSSGAGKTTVAQLIAGLFYNLGILSKPTVKTVTRADLVGQYIGQTEPKTMSVVQEAMGGVLFIDEAYQLTKSGDANDFGRVALETLLVPLEEFRDRFIVILAGYTGDMNKFMAANEGLRSRIPRSIEFPDYSPEEISRIVQLILGKGYTFDSEQVTPLVAWAYGQLPPQERSNARWARNFAGSIEGRFKRFAIAHAEQIIDAQAIPTGVFVEEVQELANRFGWGQVPNF